jgi:FkbM family methyltransferase
MIQQIKTIKRVGALGLLHLFCEQIKSDIALAKLIKSSGITTVIDVGANEGQTYSKLRKLGFKGKVLSFEPYTVAFNKMLQKPGYNWQRYEIALSHKSDIGTLHLGQSQESSLLPFSFSHEKQLVTVKRLDEFDFNQNEKLFLKVDTQGSDLNVIRGAAGVIKSVFLIQVEVIFRSPYQNSPSITDFIQALPEFELVKTISGFPMRNDGTVDGTDSHVDLIFQRK